MGKKLKLLRISLGLKQKYVADYLGVNQATLSQKESDKRAFNGKEIIMLCKLYNVDCREL